jgi:hypothetical protein
MLITLHPAVSFVYFMNTSCSAAVDELVRVFDDAIPLVKVNIFQLSIICLILSLFDLTYQETAHAVTLENPGR